ncbi:hypothetical protein, partial [Massilia alkalitolerans]|uniref:hypothetical protein n=1 Tax=Massilia alkalitolerans TaxID=286638 RepID=UPI0028A635DC
HDGWRGVGGIGVALIVHGGCLAALVKLMLMSYLGENDKAWRQSCAPAQGLVRHEALLPVFNAFY